MANKPVYAHIEVIPGPVMRTAMDVLDLVAEMLPLIPEWHSAERLELAARVTTLAETAMKHIKQ